MRLTARTGFTPAHTVRTYLRMTLFLLLTGVILTGCTMPSDIASMTSSPPHEELRQEEPDDSRREQAIQQAPAETDTVHETLPPDLATALAFAPVESSSFEYTNWTRLKTIAGVPDLTSDAPMDARLDFMMNVGATEQAIASGFGRMYFMAHAENWGWDSTDLVWEANFAGDWPPVYVLRFRDDFDFAPLIGRFAERGFTHTEHSTTHGDVTLYSHPMDITADWVRTTEFAILNSALLESENILVLSSAPDAALSVFDAQLHGFTLMDRPDVVSTATALGAAGAVILIPAGCPPMDVAAFMLRWDDMDSLQELVEELRATEATGLYTVLGVGYRVDSYDGEETPVGVFVHHYPVAELAHADLEVRRSMAESGMSTVRDVPYSELFTVLDAEVNEDDAGANLTLTLQAREHSPQLFINMVYQRDMMFSMCGGF